MQWSRSRILRCAPFAAILALGCSSSSDEKPGNEPVIKAGAADWTTMGYDIQSTYFNRAEKKISVQSAPNLTKAWEFDGHGSVTSTPVISGSTVYVLAQGLWALDIATGNPTWPAADGDDPRMKIAGSASVALSDGILYVNDAGATVHAFNAKDGTEKWNQAGARAPGIVGFSSPVVTKDYVIVGGSTLEEVVVPASGAVFRGFVAALNKSDGSIAWRKYTVPPEAHGATLWSTVSVDEDLGIVYAATGNNHGPPATDTSDGFLALPIKNIPDGGTDFLWKQQIFKGDTWEANAANLAQPDNDFGANPIVFDFNGQKLVAGGNKGGDFWVLDREKGTVLKQRNLGPHSASHGGVFINGAWDGKHLLTVCNGATSTDPGAEAANGSQVGVLFALDPLTLDIVWQRQVGWFVYGPISVANGVGFFGDGVKLQAFNTDTGAVLKEFETEGTIATAPAISNGYVVFGSGMTWDVAKHGTKFYALKVP